MRLIYLIVLSFMFAVPAMSVQADAVTIDLAEDHVDITTAFNGERLILFGMKEQEGDIAIVISGPLREIVVRKKKRILGVWANMPGIKFKNVPEFYNYSLAKEEGEIASPEVLKEAGIGRASLYFSPKKDHKEKEKLKSFQEALIRNMQAVHMFPEVPGEIVFLNDNFFRTSFYLPSNVPTGQYTIKTFLLRDGAVVDVKSTDVRVAQVGVSARIYRFAQKSSLAYGVLCVMFAMMAGWFSNAIRRRQ